MCANLGRNRGRQLLANQRIDSLPHRRVALDLDVAVHEDAVEPRIRGALERVIGVVDKKVPEDLRVVGILRPDLRLAAEEALVLVEVDSVGDVIGNHGVVLAGFGNAVHLNRQKNGYTVSLEVTSECNDGVSAPAMPIKNNSSRALLGFRGFSVSLRGKKTKDQFVSVVAAPILKRFDVNGGRELRSQMLRELHRAVDRIVVAHETSEKSQYNRGMGGIRIRRGGRH